MSHSKPTTYSIFALIAIIFSSFVFDAQAQTTTNIFELIERTDLKLNEITQIADQHFAVEGKGKGSGFKQYQRWLYEQQFHIDDYGYIISQQDEMKAYSSALPALKAPKDPNRSTWVELGPDTWNYTRGWNPGNGRVRGIAVHPSNENIIFIGSDGGGVWRSTNAGANWTPLMSNENATWMKIFDVEIAPSNQNVIYACLRVRGLIKSVDGGNSWTSISTSISNPRKIIIDPNNSQLAFVASSQGVFKTVDGGISWTKVQAGNFHDLEFKPNNSNLIYAVGASSYWRSTDGGLNWSDLSALLGTSGRRLLAVSPANNNAVYVVQANGNKFGKLLKSTDAGLTFTVQVEATYGTNNTNNFFGYSTSASDGFGQASHDMAICVSNTNENEVHIAGIICWKSIDGGLNFVNETVWAYPNSTGYNHADVLGLEYINNNIYSCSDGGVYKSSDQGDNWLDISSGLGIRQAYRISCSQTDPDVIVAGSQDNGTSMRQSNGIWIDWLGADGMDCIVSPTNANKAIGTIQFGGMYKTLNAGTTYISLPRPTSGNWISPIVSHPTNEDIIYVGLQGIYKSIDYGSNWTLLTSGVIPSGDRLNCLALAPSNSSCIYGSVGSTLYTSNDGGSSWNTFPNLGGTISSIAISPSDVNKIFITTTSSNSNVKTSSDGGTTWTDISTGLPKLAARSIIVNDDQNETLFLAMNLGVYTMHSGSPTWTELATGLPLSPINEIELQKSSKKIRVATFGRGIWEVSITDNASCDAPYVLSTSNIGNDVATLNWNLINSGSWYFQRYREQGTTNWYYGNWTQTKQKDLDNLEAGTTYEWEVRTYCAGTYGPYSQTETFTTSDNCSPPANVFARLEHTSSSSALVEWDAVNSASTYSVEKNEIGLSTWTTVGENIIENSVNVYGLTSGQWRFRVRSNCGTSQGNWQESSFVPIQCASAALNSYYLHIDYFQLQNLQRTSSSDNGFFNGVNMSADVEPGGEYLCFYSGGFASTTFPAYWKMYADFNQDGDFLDAEEEILSAYTSGKGLYAKVIKIPSDALMGKTRMRLVMKYGGYTSSCGSLNYGEVEDYALNINMQAPLIQTNQDAQMDDDAILKDQQLAIFPNPVQEDLNFEYSLIQDWQKVDVTITSISGQILLHEVLKGTEGRNNARLDVRQFSSGTYFLKVETDAGIESQKFLIIH